MACDTLQNEGEINYFTVNVVDNDNNQAVNVWSLDSPTTRDWAEGRVEVSSNGEKEYQVCIISILIYFVILLKHLKYCSGKFLNFVNFEHAFILV